MEDATKKKRGRPSLNERTDGLIAFIAETDTGNRTSRTHANQYYQAAGASFVINHNDEIPDAGLIAWDNGSGMGRHIEAQSVAEQIGRMIEQDGFTEEDTLAVSKYAASMLKAAYTVKQTANWIQSGRRHGFTQVNILETATNISLSYKEIDLSSKYFEVLRKLLHQIEREKTLGKKSAVMEICDTLNIKYEEDIANLFQLQKAFDAKLKT